MSSKREHPEVREHVRSTGVAALLEDNGLDRFEMLWSLEAPWVESPNYRRRGWSGVCRIDLQGRTGIGIGVYLKRQQGHCYRSTMPPFGLRPTAYREYRTLARMAALAIAAPHVLYYGERQVDGVWQAILMTQEIGQSISLENYLNQAARRPEKEVDKVIRQTARLINGFHRHHFEHGALYGKHVLIGGFAADAPTSGPLPWNPAVYLLDLEKARLRAFRWQIAVRDLSQLYRHAPWKHQQWQVFLTQYLAEARTAWLRAALTALIHRKARRKIARHKQRGTPIRRPMPLVRRGLAAPTRGREQWPAKVWKYCLQRRRKNLSRG